MATQNIAKLQDNTGKVIYPVTHMNAVVGIHDELDKLKQSGNVSPMVEITYDEIVALRDAGELVPGMMYRITDYTCTTTREDTQSAHNDFDIIVTAVDVDKVSETARAIRRAGDTYFENSNLEAWQIWYTLDNDITKYGWADPENGKGVVYRMIDEFNNDCPYDFKSIQFKRYNTTISESSMSPGYFAWSLNVNMGIINLNISSECIWCYTFCITNNSYKDASVFGTNTNNNIITPVAGLPHIVCMCYKDRPCLDNRFTECYNITVIGGTCQQNIFSQLRSAILTAPKYNKITNTFNLLFADTCEYNTICNCNDIVLHGQCSHNSFTNVQNTFLKNYCHFNTITASGQISLGERSSYNQISYSTYITLDYDCKKNTIGYNCTHVNLGYTAVNNVIGNDVVYVNFGDWQFSGRNYSEITIDSGCNHINLRTPDTSANRDLQNIHILRGTSGATRVKDDSGDYTYTTDSSLNITIDTKKQNYEICVGMTSDGEVRTWASTPV